MAILALAQSLDDLRERLGRIVVGRSMEQELVTKIAAKEAPESWSWVDQGGVTSVKDQGSCGSCADFAAVATIDTCMWRASGVLEDDLSEQHLMDCGYDGQTMIGCDGAFVFAYIEWVIWDNDGWVEQVRVMMMMILLIMMLM